MLLVFDGNSRGGNDGKDGQHQQSDLESEIPARVEMIPMIRLVPPPAEVVEELLFLLVGKEIVLHRDRCCYRPGVPVTPKVGPLGNFATSGALALQFSAVHKRNKARQ